MRPDHGASEDGAAMDSRGQAEIEGRGETEDAAAEPGVPPAGPHGAAELTQPAATPGAGALPDAGSDARSGTTPGDEADAATC